MKKFILFMTMLTLLAFSSICMASDGSTLNKQQSAAELFISSFSNTAPTYEKIATTFDDSLKTKMNEKSFSAIKNEVQTKFGDLKESKFYSFERLGQQDRITYFASFSKEQVVNIVCIFNKDNKLVEFGLLPIKIEQPTENPNNEK